MNTKINMSQRSPLLLMSRNRKRLARKKEGESLNKLIFRLILKLSAKDSMKWLSMKINASAAKPLRNGQAD